jgi:hypothetical protein
MDFSYYLCAGTAHTSDGNAAAFQHITYAAAICPTVKCNDYPVHATSPSENIIARRDESTPPFLFVTQN